MMKISNSIIIAFILGFSMFACDKDSDEVPGKCKGDVIISAKEYKNAPDGHHTINSLQLDGDSLRINFSSSGCSGDTWEYKLIDADIIMESFPPQRKLRLSLKNNEMCDAWFSRNAAFNICNLQVDGNVVLLNIEGSDKQILYRY